MAIEVKKKLFSFCLYGNMPIYTEGALKNIQLAQQLFPDFICRFYYDDTVDENIINKIKQYTNAELVNMSSSKLPKMIWRFLAADDKNVALFFSFDTDSRLSLREQAVINSWLQSNKQYLIVKDHPVFHVQPAIMGGMWGMKNCFSFSMEQIATNWFANRNLQNLEKYNEDQIFLREEIYPKAIKSLLYFDDYNTNKLTEAQKIPVKRTKYHFIGEAFNEDNTRRPEYKVLRTFEFNKKGGIFKLYIKLYNYIDVRILNRNKQHFIVR